jgi:hypothetical protein
MVSTARKRILILITNSFAAMNVIHSGLLKKIADQYEVHILSDLLKGTQIEHISQHFDIKINIIDQRIPEENSWVRFIRQVEKLLFFYSFNIETQVVKNADQSPIRHIFRYSNTYLLKAFRLDKVLLICLRKLIILSTTYSKILKNLDQFGFDGIVSTSPLDIRENKIVNFFKARKVRSLAMIISWDNLTSKGIINADHDYILFWNQLMADEYQRFYGIFNVTKKVRVTGIPRFDVYFQHTTHEDFRKKFGINASDKIILFATSAAKHFPCQLEIVRDLIGYSRNISNVSVIVRCHPADDYNQYRSLLTEPKLIIWRPDDGSALGSQIFSEWLPDLDFLNILSDMLQNCDVCVQVASTMRLDAAACNKPIISIAYDGDLPLPYGKSVRRFYEYSHQIPLNKLQIDEMVSSKQQLFSALDNALNSDVPPDHRSSIQPFLHYTEAKSVDSVMQNIHEWLA